MAALNEGEWIYNFGLFGAILAIPVVGSFVRFCDRRLASQRQRHCSTLADVLSLAATAVLVAGIADLVWVGTFTYVARTGVRLLVLGALILSVALPTRASIASPQQRRCCEAL